MSEELKPHDIERQEIEYCIKRLTDMAGKIHPNQETPFEIFAANKIRTLYVEVQTFRYANLPNEMKPRCEAKAAIAKGKTKRCERTAMLDSKFCYSHREW